MSKLALTIFLVLKLSSSGQAPYCVVTDFQKLCYYYSIKSCLDAARIADGICVPNENR
jgi:hypothetical protein